MKTVVRKKKQVHPQNLMSLWSLKVSFLIALTLDWQWLFFFFFFLPQIQLTHIFISSLLKLCFSRQMPFLRKSVANNKKKMAREEMSPALSADPSALCKPEQRDCFPLIFFGKLSGWRGRRRAELRVEEQGRQWREARGRLVTASQTVAWRKKLKTRWGTFALWESLFHQHY